MTDDTSLPARLLFHDHLICALDRQAQSPVGLLHLYIAGEVPLASGEAEWFQPDSQSCVVLLQGDARQAEEIAGRRGVTGAGLAHFPRAASDPDRLLAAAATAAAEARDWGGGLRHAPTLAPPNVAFDPLELDRLDLYYQPQVEVASGRITAVEALVRLRDAERGFVSAHEVIAAAEDEGTMWEMGEWALEKACAQVAAWQRDTGRSIGLAVNVSLSQFAVDATVERLVGILSRADLDPRRVELELTESVAPGDLGAIKAHLATLRDFGVRLALDDLGTGYASLSLLRALRLDKVKIDRSFVAELGAATPAGAVAARDLDGIIAWAHARGLKVLVEGVENAEQFALLRALDCDHCQGFYFSPPVSGEAMADLLAA